MSSIITSETTTSTRDVGVNGIVVDSSIVLATALLAAGSPLQRTKIVEVEFEYESGSTQTILIEYSIDGGALWNGYSSFVVTPTIGPTVVARRKTLTHHNMQLRLRSTSLGSLRVIGFYPRLVAGEKVNP